MLWIIIFNFLFNLHPVIDFQFVCDDKIVSIIASFAHPLAWHMFSSFWRPKKRIRQHWQAKKNVRTFLCLITKKLKMGPREYILFLNSHNDTHTHVHCTSYNERTFFSYKRTCILHAFLKNVICFDQDFLETKTMDYVIFWSWP